MKQNLTFHLSTITSTESKINVEAFDTSVDAFEQKDYLRSFYALLDYINPVFRSKYGNTEGTVFQIPHGSIVVTIRIQNDQLYIEAPFLKLPEKGRIPLLRQVAGLNFNAMDLAIIRLKDERLFFEYSCPLSLAEPYKIYYVLEEICKTGDKYDDEFVTKFNAQRIYEPQITPYDPQTVATIYQVIQQSCQECLNAVKYFEPGRKFGYMWNIIDTTLMKILYYAHPQGQLLNELNKAVCDMDKEDIPFPDVIARGKEMILRLQSIPQEKLAEDLYYVETFIPDKRRSNLKNIQENFENIYNKATTALENGDFMTCCLMITNKFYEMYYYNNVQDDVNAVVVKAMQKASAQSFDVAAPVLHEAMDDIMEDNLEEEEEEEEEENGNFDMNRYMQNIQQMQQQMMQAMQGANMGDYLQKVQVLQQQLISGKLSTEEYTQKVQELVTNTFGNNQ